MKKLICLLLMLCLLTACTPVEDTAADLPSPDVTAEASVTPNAVEPTPAPTAEPTPVPTPTWSEEPAEITYMLEGEEFTYGAFRYTSHLGYSMTYDPDWVRPEQYDGYDHYTAVTEVHVPDIYMRVIKTDKTLEQAVAELQAQGAEEVGTSLFGGCHGVRLSVMSGMGPADVVVSYYVTQAGDTVYILETSYFWEAAEGFGARMWAMMETIEFANAPEATQLQLMFRDKEIKDFTSAVGEATYVTLHANEGAYLKPAEWTTDNEDAVTLYTDDTGCYIEVKAEGFAKVTAKCGDLEQTVIVRCIKEW